MKRLTSNRSPKVSLIIPVFNEAENIDSLALEISCVMKEVEVSWECIWVNDGSTDDSQTIIDNLPLPHKGLHHSNNLGQSRSLGSGISASTGEFIVTLDGDGQNDPHDIPRMLNLLEDGFDLVQGFRLDRKDDFLRKTLSRVANRLARKILKSSFTDLGCTLRAVRREFIHDIEFMGEVHRVLAFHIEGNGARVQQVPVNHRPRIHGKSKYGYNRIFKFALDVVLLNFLLRFREKPLYYFGILGFGTAALSFCSVSLAFVLRLIKIKDYLDTTLLVGGIIMFINSIIFIGLGLLGEIITRTNSRIRKG